MYIFLPKKIHFHLTVKFSTFFDNFWFSEPIILNKEVSHSDKKNMNWDGNVLYPIKDLDIVATKEWKEKFYSIFYIGVDSVIMAK